ncbi:MerR family transcriptional regulator [Oceanospirillum sp. D5]|uniref:MerR family transcriptional regulator n=2 Tax=Oceanospirillum sediminis TaxID=2760088 RepID=A0A839ITX9_9GAMM|nr:MerR family transcriptional regulator [Oceanospirillum sediminis]
MHTSGNQSTSPETQEKRLFPIRLIAEQTGINPVTLRAWERRYGLIQPERTAKGHRMYREDDLRRIFRIKEWLERGVAVSQVKALLDNQTTSSGTDFAVTDTEMPEWSGLVSQSADWLSQGLITRFDQQLNQLTAIYPVQMLNQFFWPPLLDFIYRAGEYQQLIRIQFYAWLRNRTGIRLSHRNMPSATRPVWLLAPVPGQTMDPELCLTALTCADLNIPVLMLDSLPEWSFLHLLEEQKNLTGIVLFTREKLPEFSKSEHQMLNSLKSPLYLSGAACVLHQGDSMPWQACTSWSELNFISQE